jgi:hypothetical protein
MKPFTLAQLDAALTPLERDRLAAAARRQRPQRRAATSAALSRSRTPRGTFQTRADGFREAKTRQRGAARTGSPVARTALW